MKNADIVFASVISALLVILVILFAYYFGETHAVSLIRSVKEAFDTYGTI